MLSKENPFDQKRKISYYCHISSCYLGKNDIAKTIGTKIRVLFFFCFVFNLFLVAAANVMPSQTFGISLIVVTPTIDSIFSYFVLLVANLLFHYFFQNASLHAATS